MQHFGFNRLFATFLCFSALAHAQTSDWKIKKDSWSEADEKQFSVFVSSIGQSIASRKCGTLDQCFKSNANPYRETDPEGVTWFSDCADLPYNLRAYFAYKNNLPFGFVSEVSIVQPSESQDERYSQLGNIPSERFSIVKRADRNEFPKIDFELSRIQNWISSAMFRMSPLVDGGAHGDDFYSVAISRETLTPGTVIYDPNGHVAVVYKILETGEVLYIDAHPDGSLTHGVFGEKFARSRIEQGAGFKKFRPLKLINATLDSDGNFVGGSTVPALNTELPDFSLEQYFGNQNGHFVIDGKIVDFYRYVRAVLGNGKIKINPTLEITHLIQAICSDARDRVDSVQISIRDGINLKPHPETLPLNIYGAEGEWEAYATPSRDARLKASFRELKSRALEYYQMWKAKDSTIQFGGRSLKKELIKTVQNEMSRCQITYLKTNEQPQTLNLQQIEDRLFKLSFDPYQCAELRWGAIDSPDEMASCTSDQNSRDWYEAEQYLRNWIDRRFDVKMGFNLEETRHFGEGTQLYTQSPDVSTIKMLTKIQE